MTKQQSQLLLYCSPVDLIATFDCLPLILSYYFAIIHSTMSSSRRQRYTLGHGVYGGWITLDNGENI